MTDALPWLRVARERPIVLGALRVAAVVGTVLGAINHGDRILAGTMTTTDWWKFALTYLVPYAVATFSATQATRRQRRVAQRVAGGDS